MTDTAVREAFETLEHAFADPACGTSDLETGVRALQQLLITRKNAETERRNEIIEQGRERWGRGCKLTMNKQTGEWVEVLDSHGNVVPREDWDAFLAHQAAEDEVRRIIRGMH